MKQFKGTKGPWSILGGTNGTGENTLQIHSPEKQICEDVYNYEDAKAMAASPLLIEALLGFIKLRPVIDLPVKEVETDQEQGQAQAIYVAYLKAEEALNKALS